MNSIENYKIFYYQQEKEMTNESSFEQNISKQCSIFFKDNQKLQAHLVYCKKTEEIIQHNLQVKKNSDIEIDFESDIFQDDFVLATENLYLVNFQYQNWLFFIALPKNQQFLEDFYMNKRKIQARLENNEIQKIISEIKDKYIHNDNESETFNEQIYFETEINTEQNKKIMDKLEEEQSKIKSRKTFLKVLLSIGVLAFLILFFGVLYNESYFRKIKAKSLFVNRKIFTWSSKKNKKEIQKIEKLRKNLFIEDKGTKNSQKKILKKRKRHKFQKNNFDF